LLFFLTKVDPLIPAADRESIADGVTYLCQETTTKTHEKVLKTILNLL